jgi:hypothetical protein
MIKQHYGSGSDKLVEFGIQPFRARPKPTVAPARSAGRTHLSATLPNDTLDVSDEKSGVAGEPNGVAEVKSGTAGETNDAAGVRSGMAGETNDMAGVRSGVAGETNDVAGVRSGVADETNDMAGVRSGVAGETNDMAGVRLGMAGETNDVAGVRLGVAGRRPGGRPCQEPESGGQALLAAWPARTADLFGEPKTYFVGCSWRPAVHGLSRVGYER